MSAATAAAETGRTRLTARPGSHNLGLAYISTLSRYMGSDIARFRARQLRVAVLVA